nr:YadA-like C-terminal region [Neisseria gonorrhoeae]
MSPMARKIYDAVNVRQLNRLSKRTNRVGASAAALASLKPAQLGKNDKFAFSLGFGSYKNAQAVAMGRCLSPLKMCCLMWRAVLPDRTGISARGFLGNSAANRHLRLPHKTRRILQKFCNCGRKWRRCAPGRQKPTANCTNRPKWKTSCNSCAARCPN